MKRYGLILLLLACPFLIAWNPNRPAGSDTFGESHGLIRTNWWALDAVLHNLRYGGVGFTVQTQGDILAPSINTGAGRVQVWQMDQPVRTTDSVAFAHVTAGTIAVTGGTEPVIEFDEDAAFIAGLTDDFLLTVEGNLKAGDFTAQTVIGEHASFTSATISVLELPGFYPMDQSVKTTDDVQFSALTAGVGEIARLESADAEIVDLEVTGDFTADAGTFSGALEALTLDTGQGANQLFQMDQPVRTTDAVVFDSVDTGQGANQLYPMDQGVRMLDAVTFSHLTAVHANIQVLTIDTINFSDGITGWLDDGENFRAMFRGGRLVAIADSVSGGYGQGKWCYAPLYVKEVIAVSFPQSYSVYNSDGWFWVFLGGDTPHTPVVDFGYIYDNARVFFPGNSVATAVPFYYLFTYQAPPPWEWPGEGTPAEGSFFNMTYVDAGGATANTNIYFPEIRGRQYGGLPGNITPGDDFYYYVAYDGSTYIESYRCQIARPKPSPTPES